MADAEGRPNRPGNVTNPYSNDPTEVPFYHPLNLIKRCTYISGSLYILHRMKVYNSILHSPNVRHGWFKVGVAASIAVFFCKVYVEMYQGKLKKQTVNYENFKQATHATIAFLLLASLAFNVALWPAYGFKSLFVMTIAGFGVLLQLALIMPTYAQNLLGIVLLTFFLQEYQ